MSKPKHPKITPAPLTPIAAAKPMPPEKTMAEKIWLEIQYIPLDMFGLPGQTVGKYCSPAIIEPNKCYLKYSVGAVLPAMEASLAPKYTVELSDKYLVVALARKI